MNPIPAAEPVPIEPRYFALMFTVVAVWGMYVGYAITRYIDARRLARAVKGAKEQPPFVDLATQMLDDDDLALIAAREGH